MHIYNLCSNIYNNILYLKLYIESYEQNAFLICQAYLRLQDKDFFKLYC